MRFILYLYLFFCPKQLFLLPELQKEESMQNTENSAFKELHLLMLPVTGRTLQFEDELVLVDNVGLKPEVDPMSDFVATSYPFKLTFTLVMFCLRGFLRVRLNLKEYMLTRNDVLVTLPGYIGECLEVGTDTEVVVMGFAGRPMGEYQSSLNMAFRKFLASTSLIRISQAEMDESMCLYRLMRAKLEQADYEFKREALSGYLQVFFYNGCQWIARHNRQQLKRVENRAQQLFEDFLKLVQAHYAEQRSMAFYAGELCLTPKYLSQVILKASGRYANEWIRDYVILEAKALLKSGRYTVQQVGDLLNFPNASFFGKYFKAAVGCTPRKYMLD